MVTMNSPLDPHLALLKDEPLPGLAAGFEAGVWRQIARRRQVARLPWWMSWQHPRVALLAAVATVAIACTVAWLRPAPRMDARAALGLEAFAADAPHLPSTLLAPR